MSEQVENTQLHTVERKVVINAQKYKEVSLEYRQYRFSQVKNLPTRKDRLHCPMLDAARCDHVYGAKALRDTTKKDLYKWAEAMGADKKFAFLVIAYMSGRLTDIPRYIWTRRFDEDKINDGFITKIKDGINTGIISEGYFRQSMFDDLISGVYPQFKGQTLNEDLLYTDAFSECYLLTADLKKILGHNLQNQVSGGIKKLTGKKISDFEMGTLLLSLLGQPIIYENKDQTENKSPNPSGMLVRDLFDLYKYGWFPAHIEDGFIKAGLLNS